MKSKAKYSSWIYANYFRSSDSGTPIMMTSLQGNAFRCGFPYQMLALLFSLLPAKTSYWPNSQVAFWDAIWHHTHVTSQYKSYMYVLWRWYLGMGKQFHPTFYNRCNYLSNKIKINRCKQNGPRVSKFSRKNVTYVRWDMISFRQNLMVITPVQMRRIGHIVNVSIRA